MRFRGVAAGVLTLIALQALSSGGAPEKAGGLLLWASKALSRALSPDVAAIPTAKKAAKAPAPSSSKSTNPNSIVGQRNPPIVQT
jgi:hypothetical protein